MASTTACDDCDDPQQHIEDKKIAITQIGAPFTKVVMFTSQKVGIGSLLRQHYFKFPSPVNAYDLCTTLRTIFYVL